MYKIIGSDQKEYGPISADVMRQWIAEGRLNPATMAQDEANPGWKPLGQFPEFAGTFAAAASPGPAPTAPIGSVGGLTSPLPEAGRAAAAAKVKGPAIGLIITAALGFLSGLNSLIGGLTGRSGVPPDVLNNPELPEAVREMLQNMTGTGAVVGGILGLALSALILFGGLKLLKLQSRGLVMTAAIIAMLPCGGCCCIGLPIGIWTLVVMSKPDVKSMFS